MKRMLLAGLAIVLAARLAWAGEAVAKNENHALKNQQPTQNGQHVTQPKNQQPTLNEQDGAQPKEQQMTAGGRHTTLPKSLQPTQEERHAPLPKDWKKVRYARQETLPDALIARGEATIRLRVLGYNGEVPMAMVVKGFRPVYASEWFCESYPVDIDGTLTARIPLDMTRLVTMWLKPEGKEDIYEDWYPFTQVLIAPGQETEVLIDLRAEGCRFRAFRGYMARTNREYALNCFETKQWQRAEAQTLFNQLAELQTSWERVRFFQDRLAEQKRSIDRRALTEATRALLRMEAELEYIHWVHHFGSEYFRLLDTLDRITPEDWDNYGSMVTRYDELIPRECWDSLHLSAADFETTSRRYAPASPSFWAFPIFGGEGSDPYATDLILTYNLLGNYLTDSYYHFRDQIKSADCQAIVRDYEARQARDGSETIRREMMKVVGGENQDY